MTTSNEQPGMKVIYVAVFGHYDSRGGTTAMPLELDKPHTPTVEAAIKARDKYDEDVFQWKELHEYDVKQYLKDPTGWGWNPTNPAEVSSPGDEDFLYVAMLWYPADVNIEEAGDLQVTGVVARLETSLPEFGELPEEDMDGSSYHGDWTFKHKAGESIKNPTVLEYIPLGMTRWESMKENGEEDEDVWTKRILAKAKVLTEGERTIPDWDDDAFGFIVGTGL